MARDLGVCGYLEEFRGHYTRPGEARALAQRVWPLAQLSAAYESFVRRWRAVADVSQARPVTNAEAFVLRFWLTHEYQRFFLEDPDLPPELVPSDWPGRVAASIFDRLHNQLAQPANLFFDSVYEERQSSSASERLSCVSLDRQ